jgi:hypothetical protein
LISVPNLKAQRSSWNGLITSRSISCTMGLRLKISMILMKLAATPWLIKLRKCWENH